MVLCEMVVEPDVTDDESPYWHKIQMQQCLGTLRKIDRVWRCVGRLPSTVRCCGTLSPSPQELRRLKHEDTGGLPAGTIDVLPAYELPERSGAPGRW